MLVTYKRGWCGGPALVVVDYTGADNTLVGWQHTEGVSIGRFANTHKHAQPHTHTHTTHTHTHTHTHKFWSWFWIKHVASFGVVV